MARKKQEEAPAPGSPAWMATFSDLMNLLLCFFILLFASSTINEEKLAQIAASFQNSILPNSSTSIGEGDLISNGSSQLTELDSAFNAIMKSSDGAKPDTSKTEKEKLEEEKLKQSEQMAAEIKQKMEANRISSQVAIDYNSQYVQLSLNGAILFDSAQAQMKSEGQAVMDKVGKILERYSKCVIEIEGHTDNVPIHSSKFESNLYLSTARASTVYQYLLENFKLDAKYLKASGYGEHMPIASNDTPEGRAQNRRVEIKIYNQLSS